MSLQKITTESQELLQIAVEKVGESPKTAAVVSAYSTLAGVGALLDWFTGALPTLAILAGFIGALVLAWLNWKRGKLVEIQAENERLRGRLLREKALDMGVEIRTSDLP